MSFFFYIYFIGLPYPISLWYDQNKRDVWRIHLWDRYLRFLALLRSSFYLTPLRLPIYSTSAARVDNRWMGYWNWKLLIDDDDEMSDKIARLFYFFLSFLIRVPVPFSFTFFFFFFNPRLAILEFLAGYAFLCLSSFFNHRLTILEFLFGCAFLFLFLFIFLFNDYRSTQLALNINNVWIDDRSYQDWQKVWPLQRGEGK